MEYICQLNQELQCQHFFKVAQKNNTHVSMQIALYSGKNKQKLNAQENE